jgi:Na+/melibiose symporter-like transporter
LGIALIGLVLQVSGYVPNFDQTAGTLLAIRPFFGPAPLLILAYALPLPIWYPITRKSHSELLAQLEKTDEAPE